MKVQKFVPIQHGAAIRVDVRATEKQWSVVKRAAKSVGGVQLLSGADHSREKETVDF